jgi:DNA-binding transcriptional ArsR family regulator
MNDSELARFSQIFKALADETRQHILELLRKNGEMTVNDISSHFKLAQPTISQHLKVLKAVEALKVRKDGQRVFYRLCNIEMYDAMEAFMETYEQQTKEASDD